MIIQFGVRQSLLTHACAEAETSALHNLFYLVLSGFGFKNYKFPLGRKYLENRDVETFALPSKDCISADILV